MLQSTIFKNNPSLYVFLPMYYAVWVDAVLTVEEIASIKMMVSEQPWLSDEERKFLLKQIDPQHPPAPQEVKQWMEKIHEVADQSAIDKRESLVELGYKLVILHGGDANTLENVRPALEKIETKLGVISGESALLFNPSHSRSTITDSQKTNHAFDVDAMANLLDGSQKDLIAKVKKVITDPSFNYVETQNLHEYREQVLVWCKQLADHGFGAQAYPKEFGGSGDMEGYFAIMETLSYHDLSMVIKFGVQFGLFGMSVYFLGTEKHHKRYLKDTGTLKLPGCFAMTETGHGSNVKGILTTATYLKESNSFIINTPNESARKEYIGNAALHGQMATVFAKLVLDGKDYGVNAFLVPIRDTNGSILKGVTIKDCGPKMGLNGVDNGVIYFDQVSIPYENMLDRFARVEDDKFASAIASDNRRFFTMLGTLVGGRIGIPRSGNSASKSGLTIAIKYADQRRQFGPDHAPEVPILNYRTHQRRLMPLLANVYALHFSLQYLTNRFLTRSENDMQEIEALAAGLKSFTTWNTTHTLQECREACGGKGYLSENRIDSLKNDTDIFTTFEGDNTVLMQLVAKSRLTEFKQEFSNMNFFGILNYVADQATTSLMEMNPLVVRKTDTEHLLDPEFQLDAFRYRERDILTSAARRLKKHLDSGMDSFDAFNQCQFHLVNVGHAYIERVIVEQFIKQVENTKDANCKTVLKKLCDLFALSQIEKNKGWYLEHDYMTGTKTKAIRRLVNQLCWEVRQDAVPLVEAFKIPDRCLAAPIVVGE